MLTRFRRQGTAYRVPSWLGSALLALGIVLGALSGWMAWQDGREIERNTTFVIRLERVLSALKDLETGQRGYLLTGDERYLEPYRSAEAHIDSLLESVLRLNLPTDNLSEQVTGRRAAASKAIDLYRKSGSVAAVAAILKGTGLSFMEAVRTTTAGLEDQSDRRIATLYRHERRVSLPLGILAILTLLLAFGAMALLALRRRRAQQASTALLEGVLDNAPVGLGFLDADLNMRQMNKALATMSERALSATVGESIWDALPHLRAPLEARLQGVVDGGRAVANVEISAASSQNSEVQRHFQVSFYPLHEAGGRTLGRIEGAGMVVADVTSRKRSEQRLRESEERLRSLTKAVSTLIWIADPDGNFVKSQNEWEGFTGQSFDEYKDLGWLAAVHTDDRQVTAEAWSSAVASQVTYTIEHRLRRADGRWRYMAATAVPVVGEDGHVREWVGSHADITERKEAEIELETAKDAAEAANRAKSVFLANMSHELRTPLSAVIGYSEMMEEEIEDLGEISLVRDLGKIKSNARHLLSLINDVLDLSKIEANRMDVFAEDMAVGELVRDVAGTVESLIRKRNNTLAIEVSDDVGFMRTDVVKLRQCLFNLLSNAAKFAENGRLTLRVERSDAPDGDWLTFRVSDTGIGMTSDQLQRLFERFSQADETTTRQFGGTGLGLAITRAFCTLMGGSIAVESTYGVGTTFTIRLPATMPELVHGDDLGTADRAGSTSSKGDVLVIDDDASQRELMSRFLERQGFAPHAAADGEAGITAARAVNPCAILLDVMMPRMDGWAVLAALKADEDLASIPVIMVTFVHDTGLGAALGAADYLTKPVHWDKLKEVMDRFREAEGDVLLVDDDAEARERLRTVLNKGGWTTVEAENGLEALDLVARAAPRLILLDLTMPVMDGFSFLIALREKPGCAEIPVIVLTARDVTAADRKRLEGANRVLSKGEASLNEITGEVRALVSPHAAEPAASSH